MAHKRTPTQRQRIAVLKSENPYLKTSRTQQTDNFNPLYFDNTNFAQGFNLFKAQNRHIGVANETVLGHSIMSTIVDGSIGTGLSCESAVNERFFGGEVDHETIVKAQNDIEAWFSIWSENAMYCDHYHISSLPEIERQGMTMLVEHNEFFALIRIVRIEGGIYLPQIQLISPRMVSSPMYEDTERIISGIEIDSRGREIAYYVKRISSGQAVATDWERIPKYSRNGRLQMIHVKVGTQEPNQLRGTSVLMPIADGLIQIDRFNEANVAKAVVQSSIGFKITTDKDAIENVNDDVVNDIVESSVENSGNLGDVKPPTGGQQTVTIKPGMTVKLPAGQDLNTIESSSPTPDYWSFVNGYLKLMVGGRIPAPEKILKSYLASYSASQASMQESQRAFEIWISLLADNFLNIVYKQLVWCLASQNLVDMPMFFDSTFHRDAWCACNWYGSALIHNDPVKAARASILLLNAGLTTYEKECRKNGMDWETVINKLAEERQMIAELGVEISDSEKSDIWEEDSGNADSDSDLETEGNAR